MTLLDEIVVNKKKEVAVSKRKLPLSVIKKKLAKIGRAKVLYKGKDLFLIAEIKAKSPSAGDIRRKIDPAQLAKLFEKKGASAVSVLTDAKYFGGSLKNLIKAKKSTRLPIVRKDFICDEYQLYESRYYGADLVLLIASVLKKRLKSFVDLSLMLKLQPMIEVHDLVELKNVIKNIRPSKKIIVGVNNRDLKNFKVDITNSLKLIKRIPKKFIKISESGIFESHQLEKLSSAGFDGALVGEGLAKNPGLFDYFKRDEFTAF